MANKNSNLNTRDYLNFAKVVLAGILFMGYYFIMILAFFAGVPAGSENIILQGIAMIGPVIGAVASNMFPKNEDRAENDAQVITTLADKVPPATVPQESLTDDRQS